MEAPTVAPLLPSVNSLLRDPAALFAAYTPQTIADDRVLASRLPGLDPGTSVVRTAVDTPRAQSPARGIMSYMVPMVADSPPMSKFMSSFNPK